MKKRILSIMAMCMLAGSLSGFAQDNMKPESKDQPQSSDSMKHDNVSSDNMKNSNAADNSKKSSSKKKKSSQQSKTSNSIGNLKQQFPSI